MRLTAAAAGIALLLVTSPIHARGDIAAGEQKSAACAACHGQDGNGMAGEGNAPVYPRLAGQHASYIVKALEDYKSGARNNPIMSGLAAPLSAQDREDLAAYYASLPGTLVTPTAHPK